MESEKDTFLKTPVEKLNLSVRVQTCLIMESILDVADLIQRSESDMLLIPKFGRSSLEEIKEVLAQRGLSLSSETTTKRRGKIWHRLTKLS